MSSVRHIPIWFLSFSDLKILYINIKNLRLACQFAKNVQYIILFSNILTKFQNVFLETRILPRFPEEWNGVSIDTPSNCDLQSRFNINRASFNAFRISQPIVVSLVEASREKKQKKNRRFFPAKRFSRRSFRTSPSKPIYRKCPPTVAWTAARRGCLVTVLGFGVGGENPVSGACWSQTHREVFSRRRCCPRRLGTRIIMRLRLRRTRHSTRRSTV